MTLRFYEVVTPIYSIFEKKPILPLLRNREFNRYRFFGYIEKIKCNLQRQAITIYGYTSYTFIELFLGSLPLPFTQWGM